MTPTSWIEIDLDRLDANLSGFQAMLGNDADVCAVVKADAYGHAADPIAKRLDSRGVGMMAVFSATQAQQLFAAGITTPVLVMMRTEKLPDDPHTAKALTDGRLHLTLHDHDQLLALQEAARDLAIRLPIHLYIDTGMSRSGIAPQAVPNIISQSLGNAFIRLAGVYTHMACSETDPDFTRIQAFRFDEVLRPYVESLPTNLLVHIANTAAALLDPGLHRDMIRVGLGLYGYDPTEHQYRRAVTSRPALKPILRWRSRVVHTQKYKAHTTVGYNATWRLSRDSTLAVVPVGYADGYPLSLSNRGVVEFPELIGMGLPGIAQVVGRVNMDQIVIDVTDIPNVGKGSTVQLISDRTDSACSLPKLARLAESSCYELLCRIHPRVERKYTGKPTPAATTGGAQTDTAAKVHVTPDADRLIPRPVARAGV